MDLNNYRFVSTWHLATSPEDTYHVLRDIDRYPLWWPEVRRVERIDDTSVRIVLHSLLPYELTFVARAVRQDPVAGVLQTTMTGDLEGFSRWTIAAEPGGTGATFEEDVVARKPLLRRLAFVARPFFRLNHAIAERHAKQRLPVYLAGYRTGAQSRPESALT